MATNNTPQQEEVDLGKLFQIIGNGFKKLFNAIGNFLKSIFHYSILLIIFFKKQALYLGIATLLGAAIGYFYELRDDSVSYTSDMHVITNYGSAKRLYNQLNYVNNLISEKDSVKIKSIFNITFKEITGFSGFAVKTLESKKNYLIAYDQYMQTTDTIFTRGFKIKDYIERTNETDLRNHTITAYADNPYLFPKLSAGIKNLVENEYYKSIHNKVNAEINLNENEYKKNLKNIDTLRKRYNKVAILEAKKINNSGNLNFSTKNTKDKNFDIDLFNMTSSLLFKLKKINNNKLKYTDIMIIASDFELGKIESNFKNKRWFKYAIYGFILTLLTIIGLLFNKFLNNYKKDA